MNSPIREIGSSLVNSSAPAAELPLIVSVDYSLQLVNWRGLIYQWNSGWQDVCVSLLNKFTRLCFGIRKVCEITNIISYLVQ